MDRESISVFDLESAFKALDDIEVPVVGGVLPETLSFKESYSKKLKTDALVEDYFNMSSSADMQEAADQREAEIAKAKLARIEKIVDLDAETEDDLLPSYVGKMIIQCPQCMTLFYKKPEDIETSEENPDIVNINEICQHCGNISGYELVGKVGAVGEEEASQYETKDFDDELEVEAEGEELDLEAEEATEEPVEDTEVAETEELPEADDEVLDLSDEETEEEVKESLNEATNPSILSFIDKVEDPKTVEILKRIARYLDKYNLDPTVENQKKAIEVCCSDADINRLYNIRLKDGTIVEFTGLAESLNEGAVKKHVFVDFTGSNAAFEKAYKTQLEKDGEESFDVVDDAEMKAVVAAVEAGDNVILYTTDDDYKVNCPEIVDKANFKVVMVTRELKEDVEDLDAKLEAHSEYIAFLQKAIEQEEAALAKAKNDFVKQAIQRRLDAFKADLEAALPEVVKNEIAEEDLPTPEELEQEATSDEAKEEVKLDVEVVEESKSCKSLKETLFANGSDGSFTKAELYDALVNEGETVIVGLGERSYEPGEIRFSDGGYYASSELELDFDGNVFTASEIAVSESGAETYGDLEFSCESFDEFWQEVIRLQPEGLLESEQNPNNAVVKCKVAKVVTHSEDEKPVDCEGEKKPLEKPLTEALQLTPDIEAEIKKLIGLYADNISFSQTDKGVNVHTKMNPQVPDLEKGHEEMKAILTKNGYTVVDDFYQFNSLIKKGMSFIDVDKKVEEACSPTLKEDAFDTAWELTKTPISEKEVQRILDKEHAKLGEDVDFESFEEFDEESFNENVTKYMTEVYENVKDFTAKSCVVDGKKLVVEGKITFTSGKEKTTKFVFESKATGIVGTNSELSKDKEAAFGLSIATDSKKLVTESLKYNYKIDGVTIKGATK